MALLKADIKDLDDEKNRVQKDAVKPEVCQSQQEAANCVLKDSVKPEVCHSQQEAADCVLKDAVKPEVCQSQPQVADQVTETVKKAGFAAIKSEFLIHNYVPRLATEYLSAETKALLGEKAAGQPNSPRSEAGEKRKADERGDDAVADKEDQRPNKKIKLKGRNKQRPVTFRADSSLKVCPAVLEERDCKFGTKCKFYHDVAAFMKEKPEDIGTVCHNFVTFGRCPYGIACRYGRNHLTEDFKNLTDQALFERAASQPSLVQNTMTKDLQHLLWKKKYDFSKADSIVNSYYAKMRQEEGEKPGLDASEQTAAMGTDGVKACGNVAGCNSDREKCLGSLTDEGEIRLRPQEKKLIDFSNKLYLAPLTTVGNLPFRRLCKRFGADITCGEMAMVTHLLQGQLSEWALLKRHHTEDIFGVQICGGHANSMTRCAQLLQEQINLDFIDINCGCPIDLVFRKGEGCALMSKVTKFENIIQNMTSALNVPLTVKMRTGISSDKNTAHTIIPRLRDAGVSLVTIHGRSREQRYTRLADWDYIKTCAQVAAPMPVMGNGDILSYEDANIHREASGVTGLMVARGALIKPWIFTEIKEQRHWDISANERFDILRDFCDYGLEHWGSDTRGVETTRRFLLEWLSFLCRYIPVGLLEHLPQKINERPPPYCGRSDLETLLASASCADWIKISEMLLGPVPAQFHFLPKHKANAYQ